MIQRSLPPVDEQAIRDTIDAVFRHPGYSRTLRETLLDRILAWLGELLRGVRGAVGDSPALQIAALAVLGLLVLAVAARALQVAHASRVTRATLTGGRGGTVTGARGGDAWAEAQALAAGGRFTDAAHALYAAILDVLARRERVRLHPSKTVGDYGRELRRRASPTWGRYREFAGLYEVVIYGLGTCDRERYERLHALAGEIVGG